MDHSYEEIRKVALELLAVTPPSTPPNQYRSLVHAVAIEFTRREKPDERQPWDNPLRLSYLDLERVREVFWDLFREGIITLGCDDANAEFPWFKVTERGRRIIEHQEQYFFHDVYTFEARIRERIPELDAITLVYLKEAMQAFMSGCILSCSVMLGVAIEHSFNLLLEDIENNPDWADRFKNTLREKTVARRLDRFRRTIDGMMDDLPGEVRDSMHTQFTGIADLIRNYRNESGHPSGNIISREQSYILLQLFIPCCDKIYQMRHFFTS